MPEPRNEAAIPGAAGPAELRGLRRPGRDGDLGSGFAGRRAPDPEWRDRALPAGGGALTVAGGQGRPALPVVHRYSSVPRSTR